ncbi:MAG: hydantoinase B/oxoprolinase family protein [Gammaproteobacteria bacterium]|nr:hydantoinase B/oxoprolinase family protein [Gammaproteobacteria bacterium]
MNPVELSIFTNRMNAVCEEMGAVLQRAAFSPNIRDRLDFSCAVFDAQGELCAQAAHIPVHLGSMAYAMRDIVTQIEWHAGDMVVVNDPFLGGTHLPDVTLIAPVFVNDRLAGYVVNRAHHADIGAHTPGSMPISRTLAEEGIVIPPQFLIRQGQHNSALMQDILKATRNQRIGQGDFAAQISANKTGVRRLEALISRLGLNTYQQALVELNDYGERLARTMLSEIPPGEYCFEDYMDDDGLGHTRLPIRLCLTIRRDKIIADFAGTAAQTEGNINCPLSVAAAAVYYVFRCLMPAQTPACAGTFRLITLQAPSGCLLNAQRPAAVAAGNVETSMRIVDVVMGALGKALPDKMPAASHGSMNNLAMGGRYLDQFWDYYETMGGGMGAGPRYPGLAAVQVHMTNTRNTPIEVLEMNYPLRVREYGLREGSAGSGLHRGGEGLIREVEFLAPATMTLLTERRSLPPWGMREGGAAKPGANWLNGQPLPGKISCEVGTGDVLRVETAGGGGWGQLE